MSNENQHPKVAILIAIITVVGTLGAALLTNWDKVFLKPPSPSSSSSASTSKPAPIVKASSSVNLTGVWDLKFTANKTVGSDGFINDLNGFAEYVVEFNSVGNIITGKVLGARGLVGDICSDAVINGNIDGRKVNYTMQYTGLCCSNGKEIFKGELNSQGLLKGEFKPAKIPTNNCNLWYGTVIATKRASDSP
jgi:hypothetical protein